MTETLETNFNLSTRRARVAAFIIDHVVLTFAMVSSIFLLLGPKFMDEENGGKMTMTMLAVMIPGFLFYFSKDAIRGISGGKWIMGIMVRDVNHPKNIPSFIRLVTRNLFVIIWPIEVLVFASNQEKRRLGDKVARTMVVDNPDKPKRLPRIFALVGVGVAFFVFTFLFAASAMKNSEAYKVAVDEIEMNEEILNETGGIKGYGMMPTGNVSISDGNGQAQLQINVLGNKKDLVVSVYLRKEQSGKWNLIELNK